MLRSVILKLICDSLICDSLNQLMSKLGYKLFLLDIIYKTIVLKNAINVMTFCFSYY